ncbi:MAG: helix-turn-helix transcriptional regulator [Eubacterium sp.]|nr:helix-turn-helix transcriptional regulator [Eubacterium sp.]
MRFAIKELREKIGMTQEQLAEKVGVSNTMIVELESNSTDICNSKTLSKIAEVLGVSVSDIFFETNV